MPKSVVDIPTIAWELSGLLNCKIKSETSARTINKSSQLLVNSNLKMIERGIIIPIAIPKYL